MLFCFYLFKGFDENIDDCITFQDFLYGLNDNNVYNYIIDINILFFRFITSNNTVLILLLISPSYEVYFKWDDIFKLWRGMLDLCVEMNDDGVDANSFHNIMINVFHQTQRPINNNIFKCFDTSGDGYLSIVELFKGFSSLIYGSMDLKAKKYFTIFNLKGHESIKIDELYNYLFKEKNFE